LFGGAFIFIGGRIDDVDKNAGAGSGFQGIEQVFERFRAGILKMNKSCHDFDWLCF
jgi:hypothetical protein